MRLRGVAALLATVLLVVGCGTNYDPGADPSTTTTERIITTTSSTATTVQRTPPESAWDCPPEEPGGTYSPPYSQSDCLQALAERGPDYSDQYDGYESGPYDEYEYLEPSGDYGGDYGDYGYP